MSANLPNKTLGFAAAATIVCLWSGWIVTSRAGAQSPLTIYDIAALRFGISGLLALPVILYFKSWRGMSFKKIAVVSTLPGIPYILIVYSAFVYAPASHGGVFMNGILPVITICLGWLWFKDRLNKVQFAGSILIIGGASITMFGNTGAATDTAWIGDILFILAGLSFALYMVVTRLWQVSSLQVVFCSSVVNGALFVPVWFFLLPSGLHEASLSEIGLQALYQGVLATLIGMVLVAYAVRNIGAPITAAMMSGVPAFAAMLGSWFLGEEFGLTGWISIAVLTPGIIVTAIFSNRS